MTDQTSPHNRPQQHNPPGSYTLLDRRLWTQILAQLDEGSDLYTAVLSIGPPGWDVDLEDSTGNRPAPSPGGADTAGRRCAQPECLEHPDLADALGHDQQGHAILHAVTHAGITSCEQLAEQAYVDLIDVRNLGPARIARLRARLAEAELSPR